MGSQQSSPRESNKYQTPQRVEKTPIKAMTSPPPSNKFIESRYTDTQNRLTDTMLKMSLQQKTDNNVRAKLVQSRLSSLPVIEARVTKTDYNGNTKQEQEDYDHAMKAKFVGEMIDGKPHGFGKLYFQNNDYLEGTFVDGRCEGEGRIIKADGSYYEGEIKNNQADGHGKFYGIDGYKYEGQWKNNMPNGSGQAQYTDGSRYIGEFLNQKKNGRGMLFINQDCYQGQFRDGKIHGLCTFIGKNGQKYEGEWANGMKQGNGTYQWPNGRKYQGQYKLDQRHGIGTMYYSQNQKYTGCWDHGKKHGQGRYQSQKQKIHGMWNRGELHKILT